MVIDYSKWDKLTLSSDEEEEEEQGELEKERSKATIIPSPDKNTQGTRMVPCEKCAKLVSENVLMYCARCRTTGYCSKECQRGDWGDHKQFCRQANDETKAVVSRKKSVKALDALLQLVYSNASREMFQVQSNSPTLHRVFDMASLAKKQHDEHGQGIVIVSFQGCDDCEDAVAQLSAVVQGTSTHYPILKNICFEPWPFKQTKMKNRTPRSDLQQLLQKGNIDAVMKTIITNDQFALCVTFPASTKGYYDGATQTMGMPWRSLPVTPMLKPPVSATPLSQAFSQRLSTSPEFAKCRETMTRIQNLPGILWLRNILTFHNGYERHELKKVKPKRLLSALLNVERVNASRKGAVHSTSDAAAVPTFILEDGTCSCSLVHEMGIPSDFLATSVMKNTDTVFGFFVTYIHSGSDVFVASKFSFPRNGAGIKS